MAGARTAVKGEVHGVHRSAAQTLDGYRSEGFVRYEGKSISNFLNYKKETNRELQQIGQKYPKDY